MKQRIVFILTLLLCVNVAQAQNRYEEYNNIINGNAGMPGVVDLIADGKYLRAYYRLNSIVNNHYAMPSPPTEFNKYMKKVTEKITDEVVAGRMDRSDEDIMAAVRRAANEFKYGPAINLIGGNNNGNYTGGGSSTAQRQTFTANGVQFTMIRVEGGTYTMGATSEQGSDARDNEKPAHSVSVGTFYIGEIEVTQALWQAVMGSNPSYFKGSQRPVENVSWNDCQTFISKLNSLTGKNFRLPTEEEWEYAARGGNKSRHTKYSGSSDVGSVAWYCDNSGDQTHDVKTKQPNELGIYDMSGNVWEWTSSYWRDDYNSSIDTSRRVYRGGGWLENDVPCIVTFRDTLEPSSFLQSHNGLRLAL